MADVARDFIDSVMVELAKVRALEGAKPLVKYDVEAVFNTKQRKEPHVWWWYGGIGHGTAPEGSSENQAIYTEQQDLELAIWDVDKETARSLKNDLIAACYNIGGGGNVSPARFTWATEEVPGHSRRGDVLTGTITVDFPVRRKRTDRMKRKVIAFSDDVDIQPT